MKRILITLGDNDFHTVMRAFATLLMDESFFHPKMERSHTYPEQTLSKSDIVRMWNVAAAGLYAVAQNRVGYNYDESKGETWEAEVQRIGKYLQIDESKVFFDEEIDEKLKDYFCNGEAILMDWRNPSQPPFVTLL